MRMHFDLSAEKKWPRTPSLLVSFSLLVAVIWYTHITLFVPSGDIDAGIIYKRLFHHRPVIQNEVHLFMREFEVSTAAVS